MFPRLAWPLFVLLFCAWTYPGVAQDTSQGSTTAAAQSQPQQTNRLRIGIPESSPQVFPPSPVLPAGADAAGSDNYPASSEAKQTAAQKTERRGEFVIAPIPFSNQVFSFGLAPVVEYVFHLDRNDHVTPPSSLVVGGMIAEGGSWAIGGGGRLFLKRDRFRLSFFSGHGNVKYDLFGVGTSGGDAGKAIPIEQGGDLAFAEVLFKLKGKLYAGPRFNFRRLTANLTVSADNAHLPPGVDSVEFGSRFNSYAPGVEMQHDTRSDLFYPTSGHVFQVVGDFFRATESLQQTVNRDLTYQEYQTSYNYYLPLSPSQVLAFRGMLCDVDGSPPFYELCQYGAMSDIRGYQPGRYRDRRMFAAQSEYRKALNNRWGFVVFAGIGEVAHTWDSFNADSLLPGGGAGGRFNLVKKQRINLRADVAYGTTGWSWNFSLGEAF
jgi:hypothetical protein